MDKSQFMDELANILDEGSVVESANLRDYPSWDSLAILSIVAMADSKFGFTLTFPDVRTLTTVSDLWTFFEKNRKK